MQTLFPVNNPLRMSFPTLRPTLELYMLWLDHNFMTASFLEPNPLLPSRGATLDSKLEMLYVTSHTSSPLVMGTSYNLTLEF